MARFAPRTGHTAGTTWRRSPRCRRGDLPGCGTNLPAVPAMLAAEIWHWWIGIVLLGVSVLACVALVGGYLKSVTAARYPSKRQRAEAERDPDRNPV